MATYEDSKEAEFLKKLYVGRSGELENTVFALLTPDGKEALSKPGRAPNFAFRTPGSMVGAMDAIALAYPGKKDVASDIVRVPQMKNFRLSLNVASCDGLPLITAVSEDKEQLAAMKKAMEKLAFDENLAGKFIFASSSDPKEMKSVSGYKGAAGICVIKPGDYGLEGKLVKQFDAATDIKSLSSDLLEFANKTNHVEKNHNSHVRTGRKDGTLWETEIEVTDPGSKRAMERNKRGR